MFVVVVVEPDYMDETKIHLNETVWRAIKKIFHCPAVFWGGGGGGLNLLLRYILILLQYLVTPPHKADLTWDLLLLLQGQTLLVSNETIRCNLKLVIR